MANSKGPQSDRIAAMKAAFSVCLSFLSVCLSLPLRMCLSVCLCLSPFLFSFSVCPLFCLVHVNHVVFVQIKQSVNSPLMPPC